MAPPKKAAAAATTTTATGFALPRPYAYNLRSRMTRLRSGMRNDNNNARGGRQRRTSSARQTAAHPPYRRARGRPPASSGRNEDTGGGGGDSVKCAICLDTERFRAMEYIPCGHGFHAKCCERWLSRSGACPVCRTPVVALSSASSNHAASQTDHRRPTDAAAARRAGHPRRRGRHVLIGRRFQFQDMFPGSANIIIIDVFRFRQPPSR